jgi:hypothetical protein
MGEAARRQSRPGRSEKHDGAAQEGLEAYMRVVNHAQAELTAICFATCEAPVHVRQVIFYEKAYVET